MVHHRSLREALVLAGGAAACLSLVLAGPARADTVLLKNGHELFGRLVEEREDVVILRTPERGTMPVEKDRIASFIEGDRWREAYQYTPAEPEDGDEAPPREPETGGSDEGAREAGEGGATGEGGPIDPAQLEEGGWTWPREVSDERVAELRPIRDELLEELKALGPTEEERLAAVEPESAEERQAIEEGIRNFNYQQRQGSANMIRRVRRDEVIDDYGNTAIRFLARGLDDDTYWVRRVSAQALGILSQQGGEAGEEARWLLYHFEVPGKLIGLVEDEADMEKLQAANDDPEVALEKISGQSSAWGRWWRRELPRWEREQERKAEKREELLTQLALVRQGQEPSEGSAEDGG